MKIEVSGSSMQPNFNEGEIGYADKLFRNYDRFDVVIVQRNDDQLIKRIIGLPGEKIEYRDNKLFINDEYVYEDFIDASACACTCDTIGTPSFNICIDPIVLGEDEYFIMGDNRYVSNDSRYFGPVSKDRIIAKVFLVGEKFNLRTV